MPSSSLYTTHGTGTLCNLPHALLCPLTYSPLPSHHAACLPCHCRLPMPYHSIPLQFILVHFPSHACVPGPHCLLPPYLLFYTHTYFCPSFPWRSLPSHPRSCHILPACIVIYPSPDLFCLWTCPYLIFAFLALACAHFTRQGSAQPFAPCLYICPLYPPLPAHTTLPFPTCCFLPVPAHP